MNEIEIIKEQIRGRIEGLNRVRIRFWGIGYDSDETALEVRKFTCDEIDRLQAILDNDYLEEQTNKGER